MMRSMMLAAGVFAGLCLTQVSPVRAAVPDSPEITTTVAPVTEALVDPVAIRLRDLLDRDGTQLAAGSSDLADIAEFYLEREWAPAWTISGRLSEAALGVIARLQRAGEDGLDPDAYPVPNLQLGEATLATPYLLAEAEIELSRSIIAYARHATSGRIIPKKISGYLSITPPSINPIEALDAVASAEDPAAVLVAFNPAHEGYVRLKGELARLRASTDTVEQLPVIGDGPMLKRGQRDVRVVALRKRLGLIVPDVDGDMFDTVVHEAVATFQKENRLYVDGVVGPRTRAAINGGETGDPVADVIANMERWRWLPRDMGAYYVHVNVPEFMVRLMRDGKVHHETRVVVGKKSNQTPIFSDEMEHLIVNPYWNVPRSITSKEFLPKIQRDPASFFARTGYEVLSNGRRIDPMYVDWWSGGHRSIRIRQPPGNRNALGRIKFMFPNRHSVYLHDTPSKKLFGRSVRAFSHGCVRVQDPIKFADALLVNEPEWDAARLKRLFGGRSRQVNLSRNIPVHITYFTAWVDDEGTLQRRADIYGHNQKVIDALGLDVDGALKGL